MAIFDNTREIHWTQMFWLVVLSIASALTALVISEIDLKIQSHQISGRQSYWYWVSLSMLFAACAVTCVEYISREAAGSGIP